jgi:hypothetical protein
MGAKTWMLVYAKQKVSEVLSSSPHWIATPHSNS